MKGQFCAISFLPLLQRIRESRSLSGRSHSPTPVPDSGPSPKQDVSASSSQFSLPAFFFFFQEKGVHVNESSLLAHETTCLLDFSRWAQLWGQRQPCPHLALRCLLSSRVALPRVLRLASKSWQRHKVQKPYPPDLRGSLWKREGEPQLSGSVILRFRSPGGHATGSLSGRRIPAM